MLEKIWELAKSGAAFAFLTAVFGLGVAIFSATRLGFGTRLEVGPGAFPFAVALAMAAAGLICGVQILRNEGREKTAKIPIGEKRLRRVFFLIIGYLAWLGLTNILGYVPATFIASLFMAKTMGLEKWIRPVGLALGIAFSLYILFDVLFFVDLPRGILD